MFILLYAFSAINPPRNPNIPARIHVTKNPIIKFGKSNPIFSAI
ncbi:hypothetical protein [Methanobrevibacter arboriphilus]|nr:hypothetical protein [Methanobrevibacter arboriphilus]